MKQHKIALSNHNFKSINSTLHPYSKIVKIEHKKFKSESLDGEWALLIGNFDGYHLGHQALVKELFQHNENKSLKTAVLTFDPHPKMVLQPSNPFHQIYDDETKWALMEESGIDACFVIPFNLDFAQTTASEFCEKLFKYIHIKKMVVGYDFNFGKSRQGGSRLLRAEAESRGIEFIQLPPVKYEELPISSTMIRRVLFDGNFTLAEKLLGRPWEMAGIVQRGKQLGRDLGFPTMNLVPNLFYPLREGVYVSEVTVQGKIYQGICNVGYSPTVENLGLKVEAHLFNFQEDCYDCKISVRPLKFIREEKKFSGLAALKEQIALDVREAKEFFTTP